MTGVAYHDLMFVFVWGIDFTQEVASKGLGLVYEYGDAKIKEDMLYSLVGTFTEGQTIQAQSVTDNTVLFEEGGVGGEGNGTLSTPFGAKAVSIPI
jgi:proteasome component ECM29